MDKFVTLNACDFFVHFLSWVWSVVTLSQDNFAGRDFQFQKIQSIILTMVLNQNPNSFFSQNCDHMKMKNVNFSEKIGLIFMNLSIYKNKKCAPNGGLEPTTLRLKVWCSTDWANRATYGIFLLLKPWKTPSETAKLIS